MRVRDQLILLPTDLRQSQSLPEIGIRVLGLDREGRLNSWLLRLAQDVRDARLDGIDINGRCLTNVLRGLFITDLDIVDKILHGCVDLLELFLPLDLSVCHARLCLLALFKLVDEFTVPLRVAAEEAFESVPRLDAPKLLSLVDLVGCH